MLNCWKSFNTSHVVVYPFLYFFEISLTQFQYISCCSLSQKEQLFQYISCCSLSICNRRENKVAIVSIHLMLQFIPNPPLPHPKSKGFNTSHVVVYLVLVCGLNLMSVFQYISCCSLSLERGELVEADISFNTSHVVVYLHGKHSVNVHESVSIHLMLQFIFLENYRNWPLWLFQYISCCSLSFFLFRKTSRLICFNTSHVVVYRCKDSGRCVYVRVSIHLMLQFIFYPVPVSNSNKSVSIHLMLQFINADASC